MNTVNTSKLSHNPPAVFKVSCIINTCYIFIQVFTKLLKKHQKESDTLTKRLVKVCVYSGILSKLISWYIICIGYHKRDEVISVLLRRCHILSRVSACSNLFIRNLCLYQGGNQILFSNYKSFDFISQWMQNHCKTLQKQRIVCLCIAADTFLLLALYHNIFSLYNCFSIPILQSDAMFLFRQREKKRYRRTCRFYVALLLRWWRHKYMIHRGHYTAVQRCVFYLGMVKTNILRHFLLFTVVFFQERNTLSKTHNTALEKLFVNAQKNKENETKTFERAKKKCRSTFNMCLFYSLFK